MIRFNVTLALSREEFDKLYEKAKSKEISREELINQTVKRFLSEPNYPSDSTNVTIAL